jgi:hypothetical protein
MMRKIFFIRATVTPIELLLRRNAFIVLLTNQQAFEPLRSLRENKKHLWCTDLMNLMMKKNIFITVNILSINRYAFALLCAFA